MLFRSLIQPDLPRSEHDPDPTREDSQIATAVEATVSEATARAIRDLSRPIAHVDLEAPPTVTPIVLMPIVTPIVVIHPPVTGACTDPSHEPASRAQLFRLAFPAHVMLLALLLTLSTTWILLTPNMASGVRALCMALVAMGCVVLVVGSVSHLARLGYAESEQEKQRLVQEKQRLAEEKLRLEEVQLQLEERNEQLQAEKERLLYDNMQHRGPLDEEDRSAIRRGLRAGSPPSEAGGPAPSDSPPPSLPPGAPSSAATGESASGSFRSSSRAPDEPEEEEEVTPCLPSWHPPLRQQRVTAPLPSAAAEASSGQKRGASLRQVLVNEALAEMAMEEEEASAAVCTAPPYPPPHTLRASRPVCPHTPCTTQIIFEEAVAAQMQQAITYQANQETAILEITPPSPLQQKFDALVMCNFTPRKPSELPVSQWVSFRRLFHLFQPHAPLDVWLMGPGNLKQLITEWYQKHPAFAGSVVWCKRLKIADPQDGPGKFCYKFCFEYTPNGAPAPNGRSSSVSVPKVIQPGSSFSYLQYL